MTQGWWYNSKIHSLVQMCNEKLWVSKSTDNIFKDNKIKLKEHTNMHIHVKKIPGRGSWAEAYDFYFCNTCCPHLNLHKLKKI